MDIAIIGAGPVGCYCGFLLAKAGHKVSIYEEHSEIGLPIQCTGLLTSDFDQFNLPKEEFLINTFSEIEVNSPNNSFSIKQKEYLIDRCKFDRFFAEKAIKADAKIFLKHSFVRKGKRNRESNGESNLIIKDNKTKREITLNPEIVIGADGPLSKVAKEYGLYSPERKNYYGIQAVVTGKFNPNRYQTFFGREVCPDLFAWIVPESETKARAGIASTKDAKKYFEKFAKQQGFKIIGMQGGVIPLYETKQRLHKGNCYLVGDASGFVKATTLGGIIPGLQQAEILANSLINGKDYEKEVQPLRKRMELHLKLRRMFNKFEDKDWDKLISLINQLKIQRLLEKHTRENPLPLVIKTVIKEPRLLYFMKFWL